MTPRQVRAHAGLAAVGHVEARREPGVQDGLAVRHFERMTRRLKGDAVVHARSRAHADGAMHARGDGEKAGRVMRTLLWRRHGRAACSPRRFLGGGRGCWTSISKISYTLEIPCQCSERDEKSRLGGPARRRRTIPHPRRACLRAPARRHRLGPPRARRRAAQRHPARALRSGRESAARSAVAARGRAPRHRAGPARLPCRAGLGGGGAGHPFGAAADRRAMRSRVPSRAAGSSGRPPS